MLEKSDQGELAFTRWGTGPAILLLHGMTGSAAIWSRVAPLLDGLTAVAPDLLGFGDSPKPDSPYDLAAHADALEPLVKRFSPSCVVGHSMGGVIALEVLRRHPEIGSGVLVAPALFESRAQAVTAMRESPYLERLFVRSPRLGLMVCRAICHLRPVTRWLAPLFARDLPPDIARASVDHTHPSYSRSMEEVILSGRGAALIREVKQPLRVLYGSADLTVPRAVIENALAGRLAIEEIPGDHLALVRNPGPIAEVIRAAAMGTFLPAPTS
ncbi:MAG: alpha/beta hydrolase [Dehalococcoidia bacterium]